MARQMKNVTAKDKGTRIYGASDDLIEFEGDVFGETGGGDEPALIVCSDGTILTVAYGKPGLGGVWGVTLIQPGTLFDRIEVCADEDAKIYSDIAHFRAGLVWAYAATQWERVK
jgi:hypothetical protein